MSLGKAYFKIGADSSDLSKDINKAKGSFDDFLKGISGGMVSLKGLVTAAVGALGGLSLGAMIKETIDFGGELEGITRRTGIASESFQKLSFAIQQEEGTQEGLITGLRFLNRSITEATTGNEKMASSFAAVGLDAKKLKDMKPEDAFLRLADAFKETADGPAETTIAMRLLGREALDLVPALNKGSEGLRELTNEAEALGGAMSDKTQKAADQFGDTLEKLKFAVRGVAFTIGGEMLPHLQSITDSMLEFWKNNEEVIRQDIRTFFAGAALTAHAYGRVLSDIGISGPKALGAVDLILKGLLVGFNVLGKSIAEISAMLLEGTLQNVRQFIFVADTIGGLLAKLPEPIRAALTGAGFNVAGLEKALSWTKAQAKEIEPILNEGVSKAYGWADAFKKAGGQIIWASESMGMAFDGTVEPEQRFARGLDEILDGLGKTSKKAKDTTDEWKDLWDAFANYLMMNPLAPISGIGMALQTPYNATPLADISGIPGSGEVGGMTDWFTRFIPDNDAVEDAIREKLAGLTDLLPGGDTFNQVLENVTQSYWWGGEEDTWQTLTGFDAEGLQEWADEFEDVSLDSLGDKMDELKGQSLVMKEVADTFAMAFGNFFADSVSQGFASGAKKFAASILGTFGDMIMKFGVTALGIGLFEIVMGSSPVNPRPDWVAHGGWAIAQGAALTALGGLLKGVSAAIGGTASSSAGSSFQEGIARPISEEVQPIVYDTNKPGKGGQTNNIYIDAVDADSFKTLVNRNDSVFTDLIHRDIGRNGSMREVGSGVSL